MRHVEVNGVRLSAIGVGCWQFGSNEWGYGKAFGDSTAGDIVRRALDLGVNLLDTAEMYARGVSETIVGRAIEGRRDEAFVATKVWPVWPTAERVREHGRLSAMRLGVGTIDLYQVHWPNPAVPTSFTMAGMRRLQDDGLVRHVGVSNYSAGQWRAAEGALGRPVLSNQVNYSLVQRKPEREVLPHAQANDRLVIAYSPLGQGLLGGRYDEEPTVELCPTQQSGVPPREPRAGNAIDRGATGHRRRPFGHAGPGGAGLADPPANVVAIPGASSVEQLEHNVAAADLELTDDDDERLTTASDRFEPIRGAAAVPGLIRARVSKR